MPDDGVPMSMAPLEDDSIATASAAQPDGFDYDAAEYEADQARVERAVGAFRDVDVDDARDDVGLVPTEFLAEDASATLQLNREPVPGPVARLIERRPRGVLCCWAGFALFAALWIAFGWVDLSLADDMFRLEDDPHVYRHDAMLHLQPFTSGSQLNRHDAAARARRRTLTPAAPTTCADDAERRQITLVYSSRSGGDGGNVLRPTELHAVAAVEARLAGWLRDEGVCYARGAGCACAPFDSVLTYLRPSLNASSASRLSTWSNFA